MLIVMIYENPPLFYADAESTCPLRCLCDTCYPLKVANATQAIADLNSEIGTLTQDIANARSCGLEVNSIQANIQNLQNQLAAQERRLDALRSHPFLMFNVNKFARCYTVLYRWFFTFFNNCTYN